MAYTMLAQSKPEIPVPSLTPVQMAFHVVGVALNGTCTFWGLTWLLANWQTIAPPWFLIVVIVLFGLFIADFFSGLLHWAFDTWFSEETPMMKRVVLIVREHHVYPQHIFRYKFHYEAGTVSWASLAHTLPVIGTVTLIIDAPTPVGYSAVFISVMLSIFTLFMLQFHKLGHRRINSRILMVLQRSHLLMSVQHHSQHHRGRHDIKYCLINGWADYVCDKVGFWRGVERVISRLTGAVPRKNDDVWMGAYRRRGA